MATGDTQGRSVGVLVIESRRRQAWRAFIPLVLGLGLYGGVAVWLDGLPLIVLLPLTVITGLFVIRFLRWRRRGDIVDTGSALEYVRDGQVLNSAPWDQIDVVGFSSNRRMPPQWSAGGQGVRGLTPLPCVWVRKKGEHNQFIHDPKFGDVMLTRRADIRAARRRLAAACERHGVSFADAWDRIL